MPGIISGISILEGDGGPGTIRQSNFTDGKKVKSTSFELKFEARKDGGSICKLNGEYETNEDGLPTEAETKEMMGSMVSMFKVIEGYLVANPAAYA
ncbi:hypothetical protein MRB53_015059 [Persea americana]|uniref:Uncharacterized protein n=1 Tax=Persea americana TaxID=3435 RepID=A0ACC2KCT0_PERAE|nr:hypothetical protein MRB53_015059 [Persea americana]